VTITRAGSLGLPGSTAATGAGTPAAPRLAGAIPAAAVPAAAGLTAGSPAAAFEPLHPVLLINGDRILAGPGPGGGRLGAVLQAARGGVPGALTSLTLGGQAYVVPTTALPYPGRGLDPSLFELSQLRRLEHGGRLAVRIGFRRRLLALPGIRITRSGRGSATGYLTASSARLFGAVLGRQLTADHARASCGTDGIFAGRESIALARAPAAPPPARPDYPMHTLTVTGSNLTGHPNTGGSVYVFNVDDSRKFAGGSIFYHGAARFSVPAGLLGYRHLHGVRPRISQQRVVILPQFTVTGNTTVHLDERDASSQVAMVTPRPAISETSTFEIRRPSRSGPVQYGELEDTGLSLWVTPTASRPTAGTLQTFTGQQLVSLPGGVRAPARRSLRDHAGFAA
jgi:hypothetical protein